MDYKELLKDQDFSSPQKIADWMHNAMAAIEYLLARAEAAEARAEKVEKERDAAVKSFESFVKNNEIPCAYCKSCGVVCSGNTVEYCGSFEYRGPKKEK